eukprot:537181_1
MANGVCNTEISGCNMFLEIMHLILVAWNIYTDCRLLVEMKSTSNTYDEYVQHISSSPKSYEYTFCYPENYIPTWYSDIYNETLSQCDCFDTTFYCNESNINESATIPSDISCEAEIFGLQQQCQQVITINNWECQDCICDTMSVYSEQSLPVQRLYYEYNTLLNDIGYEYCDPYAIVDGKLNAENHLEDLIICSITFLVVGIIAWCGSTCCRFGLLKWNEVKNYIHLTDDALKNNDDVTKKVKKNDKTYEHDAKLYLAGGRMLIGFIANLFHDIPHQIILLFFVVFLYSDYGYYCFRDFVNYPSLSQVTFNSNEDLGVILARNYPIFSSVFAWSTLVLFNAGWNTYQMYIEFDGATRAGAQTIVNKAHELKCGICLFYTGLTVFFFIYILSHWCWPAFVAYYFVAPALHKEWFILQIIFWSGVWIWPFFIIGLCILAVMAFLEKCC